MRRLLLAASVLALATTGFAGAQSGGAQKTQKSQKGQPPANETAAQRLDRIRAENEAAEAQYRADVERYNREVQAVEAQRARDAEAQRQYERDLARHNEEVARIERERQRYERRRTEYDARMARRNRNNNGRQETAAPEAPPAPAPAAPPAPVPVARSAGIPAQAPIAAETNPERCAERRERNRRRGRTIGGIVGGVAGGVLGGRSPVGRLATAALSAPVGALIGDAIASRLDCEEQRQAAAATEQAVQGGVGTTVAWESQTRSGVTGTSTVTAVEAPTAGETGGACLTVTDIIIVDGEETRAPKRMCRRPPTNRYVRV